MEDHRRLLCHHKYAGVAVSLIMRKLPRGNIGPYIRKRDHFEPWAGGGDGHNLHPRYRRAASDSANDTHVAGQTKCWNSLELPQTVARIIQSSKRQRGCAASPEVYAAFSKHVRHRLDGPGRSLHLDRRRRMVLSLKSNTADIGNRLPRDRASRGVSPLRRDFAQAEEVFFFSQHAALSSTSSGMLATTPFWCAGALGGLVECTLS